MGARLARRTERKQPLLYSPSLLTYFFEKGPVLGAEMGVDVGGKAQRWGQSHCEVQLRYEGVDVSADNADERRFESHQELSRLLTAPYSAPTILLHN